MESKTYDLDLEGDVMLTLRNPNAPFAVCPENIFNTHSKGYAKPKKGKKKKKKQTLSFIWDDPTVEAASSVDADPSTNDQPAVGNESIVEIPPDDAEPYVEIGPSTEMPAANLAIDEVKDEPRKPSKIILRLSSAHLRLASPYFKKAMSSGWKEASLDADGLRHFDAEDWDEESLVILMRIIHRLNHHVPKKMNLERLAKIAVLVDYYQCHEVVEPFTEIWQQAAKALRPKEVGRDLVLLLFVSRTFRWHSVFETTTKTALEQCKGPLPTLHLPIPLTIVDNIDRQRLLYIDQIIDLLHGLLVDFRDGRNQCSFECSSILLGALMKELYDRGLEPKRDSLYDGHSLVSLKLAVSSIRSPKWKPVASASTFGGTPQPHSCDLASIIQLKMKDLANVEGLKLC